MLITRWYWKLAYIVCAAVVIDLIGTFFAGSTTMLIGWVFIGAVLEFLAFWYGARVFRGKGESAAPRPSWRWTSKPALSRLLGSLLAVGVLLTLIALPFDAFAPQFANLSNPAITVQNVTSIVLWGVLAFFYFRSYSKLRRLTDFHWQPTVSVKGATAER